MKEFLYILFCVVILGLGILLLNSKGADDLFLSEYPEYVSPGVDFSKMNNIKSSYVPPKRVQPVSRGLIGNNFSNKAISGGNTSLLPAGNQNLANNTPSTTTGGLNMNKGSLRNSEESPLATSMLFNRTGNGNAASGSQDGNNLIAGSSTVSENNLRSFVPMDPFNDYREGDITHPGGSPVEDPLVNVPVGDGLLPLFLMGLTYTMLNLFRRKLIKKPR